jgi:hypothetical protein
MTDSRWLSAGALNLKVQAGEGKRWGQDQRAAEAGKTGTGGTTAASSGAAGSVVAGGVIKEGRAGAPGILGGAGK